LLGGKWPTTGWKLSGYQYPLHVVDIIKWMGLEEEIRRQSTNEEGVQVVDANGNALATFGATGKSDVQSATSEYEIFRNALAKIFIDPIAKQVKLDFDDAVESYEQRDEGVLVTFAKSKEVKTFDLLVAADGLGSKLRGMMLKSSPQEKFVDEGIHTAYFTIQSDLLKGGRLAKGHNTTRGRAIYLRPDPDPAGRTRCILSVTSTRGDIERKGRLNQALGEGNESYMQLMEEMFQDSGWLAEEVLQGMRESDDFYCSPVGQIRSHNIHDGRVVFLGDAAYATPGFGTSLAIIGGYVLAGELLNNPRNVKTALKRYEETVLPFAKSSQWWAHTFPQLLNPQTLWGVSIRNTLLAWITWTKFDRVALKLAWALGFTEKKIPMPDYLWPSK